MNKIDHIAKQNGFILLPDSSTGVWEARALDSVHLSDYSVIARKQTKIAAYRAAMNFLFS